MTTIEWTELTWNPVVGCSVTSPGCRNCYAMKMAHRLGANPATPHYAGLTQMSKGGPVWAGLVPPLEELGYRVAAGFFSAGEVGAAHRRERLYVMADAGRGRRAGSGAGQDQQSGRAEAVSSDEVVAHADGGDARPGGQQRGGQQRFQSEGDGDCGKLAHANGVGLQGIIAGRRDPQGRHKPDEFFELRGRTGQPLFAPGPIDASWPDILALEPFLAPSLSDLDIAAASFSQSAADLGAAVRREASLSISRRQVDVVALDYQSSTRA